MNILVNMITHTRSDINECVTGAFTCDAAVSTCSNTPGSYTCKCSTGYKASNGLCIG